MTEEKECKSCTPSTGSKTEHKELGYVPVQLVENSDADVWVKAFVCTDCGTIGTDRITEADIEDAEEDYIQMLVNLDLVSETGAEDILDGG